jgi:PAS domain S-box-containing protein
MGDQAPPAVDQDERELQLRQFIGWLIPIVLGFVPLLLIAYAALGHPPLLIAGVVLLGYGMLLVLVRRWILARPGQLESGVAAICAGLFAIILLLKLTEPLSPATLAVAPLLAVAIALPYARPRLLRWLLLATWLLALLVAVLNELAAPVARLPLWLSVAFRAGSFAVVVALLLLLLWQFSRRLAGTVESVRAANMALRESEALYRALFEQANDAIFLETEDDTIIDVNQRACELLGYTRAELLAMSIADLQAPEVRGTPGRVLSDELDRHRRQPFESIKLKKDGSRIWVEITNARLTSGGRGIVLSVLRDITERKRAADAQRMFERQQLEAQRLESLTILAGGIAHDFNNILAIILGNVDLARVELPADSSVHELLAPIVAAVRRASDLTQQMLAYSGKSRFLLEPLDLNDLLHSLREPIKAVLSARAQLVYQLAAELPLIEVDPSQIRQAVLNLVINAAEAIGEAGGTLMLRTAVRDFERADLADMHLAPNLSAGRYVVLEVADTGVGMDEEAVRRIFEPFFTTKFMGRGLGMPAVLGIVRGHYGAIGVRSAPSQGSTFTLLLPAAEE